MNIKHIVLLCAITAAALHTQCMAEVQRMFRAPSCTRGNAGLTVRYGIERASWIAHPSARDDGGGLFVKCRRRFHVKDNAPFEIDVSGDGRFALLLDGKVVSRGPHRGMMENWQFQSYGLSLEPGEHLFEAVVWSGGEKAPRAQLEHRPGFVLKASGAYDDMLTTGKAAWEVGIIRGTRFTGQGWSGAFGTGWETRAVGTGLLDEEPAEWTAACVSEEPQGESIAGGVRRKGRLMYPSQLPDQLSKMVRPGEVVDGGELCGVVPKNAKRRFLWDLGDYYCAYPVLKTSGGAGATVRWGWAESLRGTDGAKGNRNEWRGKKFNGFGDRFVCDGRDGAVFTAPWMRCGRWCEILVETADEPLDIRDAFLEETRYPLEREWSFECSDPSVGEVLAICRRGMEECTHEMLFDCPFYEQQMYPGDGRVELLVLEAGNRDRRIVQRVVELFDLARRNDGFVPMNFPCWLQQESGTYTMCYAMMYGDLAKWGADAKWLSARLPGLRHTMSALQRHENEDGLLVDLPGWPFVDWVPEWNHGEAPDGRVPGRPNAIHSLFWVLAMQSAAAAERRCGDDAQADYWLGRARRTFDAVRKRFWDEGRGLFADDLAHSKWSEHAQSLAIITGLMHEDEENRAFEGLISSSDLARATVYFSHYLFEAYFRHGRGDLFLKKLDLWREYVRLGLKTPLESPGANARSDCHAWGAHPIYHALSGLAGIRPAALNYSKVIVAPCPGGLSFMRAHAPHPQGEVVLDLRFGGTGVAGMVTLPHGVDGIFKWGGIEKPLASGENKIEMIRMLQASDLTLDVDTGNALHLVYDASSPVAAVVSNTSSSAQALGGRFEVRDRKGRGFAFPVSDTLPPDGVARYPLPGPLPAKGFYWIRLFEDNADKAVASTSFAFVERHKATPLLSKPKFRFGFTDHPLYYAPEERRLLYDAFVASGAKLARVGLAGFGDVLSGGEGCFDWRESDEGIEAFRSRGISLNATIYGAVPRWAAESNRVANCIRDKVEWAIGCMPPREGVFKDYCRVLAARYGTKIDYYEIGNEFDMVPRWILPPKVALRLQREAWEGIKESCPTACVTTCGWAVGGSDDYFHKGKRLPNLGIMEEFLEKGQVWFDVLPVHLHGSFENYETRLNSRFFPLLKRYGVKQPWYSNETADHISGGREVPVAIDVWRKILYAWAHGSTDYTWYNLRAKAGRAGAGVEWAYGVMTHDWHPMPAFASFCALAAIFNGLDFERALADGDKLKVYRFKGGDRIVLAGWIAGGGHSAVQLATDARGAELCDVMGQRMPLTMEDGKLMWEVTEEPSALVLPAATQVKVEAYADRQR